MRAHSALPRIMQRVLAGTCLTAVLAACTRAAEPDAYGNVEATTVVVGSEASGRLLRFVPVEGTRLAAGDVVAVVDTQPLALQLTQIAAQRAGSASRGVEVTQQIDVLEVQRRIAQRTYDRTRRLFDQQAATAQQLDQAERDYRVLVEQIEGARAQRRTVGEDVAATAARAAQVRDQLRRSEVANPLAGTVLTTYAKAGEVVQIGQPLYKIASLDTVELRAYVSESQLAQVRVGGTARVSFDAGPDTRRALDGTIAWVASEAEFTPTPIQSRDERTNLVYAVKIRVPNTGGALKIGMPADVTFAPVTTAAR
jgi:HlyD family secretion protein